MRLIICLLATLAWAPCEVLAGSEWWEAGDDAPDYRYELRIESIPSGAEVCATPTTSYDEPVIIGRTPMVLPIELRWERLYSKRIWKALHVISPGDVCESDYAREDGSHTLFLDFTLRSPGYADTNIVFHLGTLVKSDIVWTNVQVPPYPKTLRATLRPAGGAQRHGAGNLRTVMIASGSGGLRVESGTVSIFANTPFATLVVNGQAVGAPPVRLVLDAGAHRIELSQPGYITQAKDVDVAPGADLALRFHLLPE
jgi:hypothetical protein